MRVHCSARTDVRTTRPMPAANSPGDSLASERDRGHLLFVMRATAFIAAVLCVACADWPARPVAVPPSPPVAKVERPIPYPIFESKAFARAVERGTRTRAGEPGPKYWQQFARYRIDAELVPATNTLNGRETVRYFNRSPDTLRTIWVFLNQNIFAPSSPRNGA